jgi:hypothetical protein
MVALRISSISAFRDHTPLLRARKAMRGCQ